MSDSELTPKQRRFIRRSKRSLWMVAHGMGDEKRTTMTQLNKCLWIVDALLQAGERGLSLKELNEKWLRIEMSYGEPIPRQTFNRLKGVILDTMGVVIECHCRGGYRYYIYNPEVLNVGEMSRWLLDTYSTAQALSGNVGLKERIIVEDVPSSHRHLTTLMEAMRSNKVLTISYRNFQHGRSYSFPVAPYCLKLFQKRWYLLAHSLNDDRLRLYGVERIEAVAPTQQRFTLPDDFDARTYFATFFGVALDESVAVQRIVLRANQYHQHYLRTVPLHPSQRELTACKEYADFELTLRPTYDFCMELLKVGSMVEVLEPESLRNDMRAWVKDLWRMYE